MGRQCRLGIIENLVGIRYLFWRIIAKKIFWPVPISTKKLPTRGLGIQRKLRQPNSNIPTNLILHEFDLNFGTVVM